MHQLVFQFKINIIPIKPMVRVTHRFIFQWKHGLNTENLTSAQSFPHVGEVILYCSSQHFRGTKVVMTVKMYSSICPRFYSGLDFIWVPVSLGSRPQSQSIWQLGGA